ncbi:hypothetical protein PIROE2DRAFT_3531, partial [Piromyces sp. E2]
YGQATKTIPNDLQKTEVEATNAPAKAVEGDETTKVPAAKTKASPEEFLASASANGIKLPPTNAATTKAPPATANTNPTKTIPPEFLTGATKATSTGVATGSMNAGNSTAESSSATKVADIVRSIFNSNNRNVNSENSGNNSGNNSREIGLNNSSHEISNNSDSVNENFDGRPNYNRNKIEWENLCKYQLKYGSLSDIPFLVKTAAFFNKVMPIVSGQRWSVINRYSTKVTKSANADNTVRQASSANDHISAYTHATERNRNSLTKNQIAIIFTLIILFLFLFP